MSKYKVDICGVDTSKLVSLTNEENNELFLKMSEGDRFAREDLIYGNLKLVLSILKRFSNKVDNLDDLFQVGCLGLIKAIDNFDTSYQVTLSTYAIPMILGEIKRYIRDNNSIRVSRSLKDISYKAIKLKEEYFSLFGREPTYSELAEKIGVSEYELCNALLSLKDPVSMYEPIYNDGGDTIYLYDQIEDKKNDYDISSRLAVSNAMEELKERERYILDERFIVGKSQMEIADELDISQAQVSRLEKKAINQLKKVLK